MPPPTYPPTIQYLQPNFAKEQSEGPEVGSGEEEEESEEEESSYEDSAIEHEAPPGARAGEGFEASQTSGAPSGARAGEGFEASQNEPAEGR